MADQNWRTEVNALDYFGNQKKQASLDNRRPVIRKPSDLVGPGIAANAIRLTDFNDHLATYDGFFSADVGALNAPNSTDAFVGTVTSDETLGGVQTFSGLTTQANYQRVFNRNPSDEATIYWGDWEIVGTAGTGGGVFLETLPASIMDAKGDLIVGAGDNAPVREAVGDDGESVVADSSTSTGIRWDTRVRTIVPEPDGPITVDDTDPLNPIIGMVDIGKTTFQNTDFGYVAATGSFTMNLKHTPLPGSEHVTWHPANAGGIHLRAIDWTRVDKALTIPSISGLAVGDVFTCEYAYLYEDPTPISPSLVGSSAGVAAAPTTTFPLPVGTQKGDVLVLVARGDTGTGGGGELVDSVSCSDPRMTLAHAATRMNGGHVVVASTWVGIEDGSGLPIVINSVAPSFPTAVASGVLCSFTGVNGYGNIAAEESSGITPVIVDAIAAVATQWDHGTFVVFSIASPTAYTFAAQRGLAYNPTEIAWWYDPTATATPTSTYGSEGCCVIELV